MSPIPRTLKAPFHEHYVIERYIDADYKVAGLTSFVRYVLRRPRS